MLGTALIGMFYTRTLHRNRSLDPVAVVYSRTEGRENQAHFKAKVQGQDRTEGYVIQHRILYRA